MMMLWINVTTCCEERSLKRGPIYSEGRHSMQLWRFRRPDNQQVYQLFFLCYRRFYWFHIQAVFLLDDGTTQNAQRQASIDTVCTL